MLGKNNQQARAEKRAQKKYKYAVKKLAVGVASVAIGASLQFAAGDFSVLAEEASASQDSLMPRQIAPLPKTLK